MASRDIKRAGHSGPFLSLRTTFHLSSHSISTNMVCNYQRRQGFSSAAAAAAVAATTVSAGSAPVNYHGPIKPINTTGGQWYVNTKSIGHSNDLNLNVV